MTRRLRSGPVIGLLVACFVALVAAFMTLPAAISNARYDGLGQHMTLRRRLADGLVELWGSGRATVPPDLQRLADYWGVWHATKIVISSLLVVTLLLLAVALWGRFVDATRRRTAWGWAAGLATVLLVMAGGLLAANVQATVEPSVALLPLVPDDPAGSALDRTLLAVGTGVTDAASPQARTPALRTLVAEVERYHWAMVVCAAVLALVALAVSADAWRRRRTAEPAARAAHTAVGTLAAVATVLYLLLMANSLVSALDPSDALLAVLGLS